MTLEVLQGLWWRLRIGELAARLGVSRESLRYYERTGLLPAATRRAGGYREYDEETAERLRLLVALRQVDLPLVQAATLAAACAAGHCELVAETMRREIPARPARIGRQFEELRHVDQRLALLADQLEAGLSLQAAIVLKEEAHHV